MNNTKEIAVREDQSPVSFMNKAIAGGLDIEKIEKMLELQAKYEAMEAKKAYNVAMAEFKALPLMITKDKDNKQYNSKYVSIGNLVNTVVPLMSKSGLSHKWEIKQSENAITISCIITHVMGHSESTTMSAPPDGSGSKNPIQQIKSTRTYLHAATFESAMGLASTDADLDDDGNAFSKVIYITKDQVKELKEIIDGAGIDKKKYLKWAKVESLEKIETKWFPQCLSTLKTKADS